MNLKLYYEIDVLRYNLWSLYLPSIA